MTHLGSKASRGDFDVVAERIPTGDFEGLAALQRIEDVCKAFALWHWQRSDHLRSDFPWPSVDAARKCLGLPPTPTLDEVGGSR